MAEPRTVRENANALTSEQIAAILPHRYPFALVDRITGWPGKCPQKNSSLRLTHLRPMAHWPGS